jgi:DNA-binding CsgD family transcriptional regulator
VSSERETTLVESDVRSIVRLLGDVAGSREQPVLRKRQLISGLSRLVGADGWLWSVTRGRDHRPICCALVHGGLDTRQLTAWAESTQTVDPPLPEHEACEEIARNQYHATRTREQMVGDEQWYANPTVRRYRLEVGIDDFLYSLYPLGEPYFVSAIGLYRRTGRERFSPRERRIAHIVLSEVPWLHTAGLPEDQGKSVPDLPPRLRTVFVMLFEGHDRKRIAVLLGLSEHTVKEYISDVYRHFGVSSQVELIRRFALGDGRDVPPEARPT